MSIQVLGIIDAQISPQNVPTNYNGQRFVIPPGISPAPMGVYLNGTIATDVSSVPVTVAQVQAVNGGLNQLTLNPTSGTGTQNTTTFSAAGISIVRNILDNRWNVAKFPTDLSVKTYVPTPFFGNPVGSLGHGPTYFDDYPIETRVSQLTHSGNCPGVFFSMLDDGPPKPPLQQANIYVAKYNGNSSLLEQAFNADPYLPTGVSAGLFQGVTNFSSCPARAVDGWRQFCFIGKGSSGIHGPLAFDWLCGHDTGTVFCQSVTYRPVTINNAVLQDKLDNELYTAFSWFGGHIFVFYTYGSGPTGQPNEILVCDPALTSGYLVRLQPTTVAGRTYFSQVAGSPTWSVKITDEGLLYATSSINLDNAVYYGPLGSLLPLQNPPISLPCYFTCMPNNCNPHSTDV